jgi:hypothetical protein
MNGKESTTKRTLNFDNLIITVKAIVTGDKLKPKFPTIAYAINVVVSIRQRVESLRARLRQCPRYAINEGITF